MKDFVDFSDIYEEDEDLDSGKMNSRKRLAPLFLFEILRDHSSPQRHLTQSELIRRLDEYPYALCLERKAVSRNLHLLADADIGIHFSRNGSWYAPVA